MGAYYEATINNERYNTHDVGCGLKLMEHAYIGNPYVETVMSILVDNPKELRWVCDYTESTPFDWDETNEVSFSDADCELPLAYYILNETKGLSIDIAKLITLHANREMMIHPLPILCNSEEGSMGGGDLHRDESQRATWCGDIITITFKAPDTTIFTDVTEDVVFTEG